MTMVSHLLRVGVVAAAAVAAACSTPVRNGPEQVFDISTQYPVSVQPRMMTLDLLYNGQAELDENASGQIARFARDYLSHGSGSIAVAPPQGNAGVSNLVIAELLENGVLRNQIMIGNAAGRSDDIRLTFIRYVAETAPCGDWSKDLGFTAGNTAPPNLGCATQHNIAAMVADPRDLLAPDTSGQPDAQRRLTVLDNYRKGVPTPAIKPEALNAILSNVAAGGKQ